VRKRSALMSEDTLKNVIVSASVRRFTELSGRAFLWIDDMHRTNCPFHLHSPFLKQTKLLNNLSNRELISSSNIVFRVKQFL